MRTTTKLLFHASPTTAVNPVCFKP